MLTVVVDWNDAWRMSLVLEFLAWRKLDTDSLTLFLLGGVVGKDDWSGGHGEPGSSSANVLLLIVLGEFLSSDEVTKLPSQSPLNRISLTGATGLRAKPKKQASQARWMQQSASPAAANVCICVDFVEGRVSAS